MTKEDLATLVVRGISLWFGVTGVIGFVSFASALRFDGPEIVVGLTVVGGAFALWAVAPAVARRFFARGEDEVPLAIASGEVPAIAAFVIGLYMLATAIPQAAAWIGILILRSRTSSSLIATAWGQSPDERAVSSAIALFAQIVIGVVLTVNSRRFGAAYVEAGDTDVTDAE